MNTTITAIGHISFRCGSSGRMAALLETRFPVSLSHRLPLSLVMAIVLCPGIASSSHAQAAEQQQKFDRLMQRFPKADANKDGKLTIEEAKAYNTAHPELRRNQQADGEGKATVKGGPARWEEAIKQFEAADAATPPPKGGVLLVGGSNARRWTNVGDYFPQHRVINRGFGGATLSAILHYTDRIVLPYAPKTVFLNAGGNDLKSGKNSPEKVCEMARAFSARINTTLPDTKVYAIGLPHILNASNDPEALATIKEMNRLLAELAKTEKNFGYIDLFSASVDDKGKPQPDFFVEDGTHLSPKGYETLANLLREKL